MLGPSLQTEAQFRIEVKISVSALCKAVQEMMQDMQEQASKEDISELGETTLLRKLSPFQTVKHFRPP